MIAIPRFIGTLENARIRTDAATARAIASAVAVGEAEGTYTLSGTTGPDVATLQGNDYLAEVPESSIYSGGSFTIAYVDGAVSVINVVDSADENPLQVYPVPITTIP